MTRRALDRRRFLETLGIGSIAAAGLPLALDALSGSAEAAGIGLAADDLTDFRFVSNDNGATSGAVKHFVLMNGSGTFSPSQKFVTGGGSYVHVDSATPVPQAILDAGTWSPTSLVSFTLKGTYGVLASGVVTMLIALHQTIPTATSLSATLTVVCNLGPAGQMTGEEEGWFSSDMPGGPYIPVPVNTPAHGLTVFTIAEKAIPLSATPYYGAHSHRGGGLIPT